MAVHRGNPGERITTDGSPSSIGEEGRADSSTEKGFAEVLVKYPNRTI